MAIEIKNKSEFVRGVLREIGALQEPAPEGWRQKVEAALAKQNLTMHQVMIYQIRKREIDKLAESGEKAPAATAPKRGRKPGYKVTPKAAPVAPVSTGLSVTDLLAARKVADEFGGVAKLTEALTALSTILGTK
jgi:hypothetical protein